ncbi:MAG: gamma-glutamyltransferase [Hyphomicrobiales bacterium]|nr:gamma-glutamyltransferase [Hyphomicrobiales bacterium]
MRDLELPGRSPVHATGGMACTSHPLSSQVAVDILKAGGNAMDAAVAACAVQCVVEPESTGIGGDCFCLYAGEGAGVPLAFNGSGRAPAGATPQWFADQGITHIERQSPHSVTIPSAIDAWDRLVRDHGRMALGELLQPAIRYARDGYPISSRVHYDFAIQADLLRNDENAARVMLPGDKVPAVGSLHRQPELAKTLQTVADNGRDAFYTGAIAQDMVDYLQSKGGVHTLEDFAAVKGEYVEPISAEFRGHRVFECPPNGQGVIALLLLNIMSEISAEGDPMSLERVHAEIEACRLAYAERDLYVADPAQADVPVDWLLSEENARALREAIDPEQAGGALPDIKPPAHESTVYISVVDKDRNCCSFINTLFSLFGSCQMAPKSGVMLQNRGQGFTLENGHPNCIAPGKRPLHTIIPGMIARDGRAVMSFGVMGGQYQAAGHMQFLTRFFDYGLDIQQAMDLPRFCPDPATGVVDIEDTVPAEIRAALVARGHRLVRPQRPIGGSQAIWIDWEENVLTGGSDPRKDGCAIGY